MLDPINLLDPFGDLPADLTLQDWAVALSNYMADSAPLVQRFEADGVEPEHAKLIVAVHQLEMVLVALRKLHVFSSRMGLLRELQSELANALNGASSPISVSGRKKKGRPLMRLQTRSKANLAAAAVELLVREMALDAKASIRKVTEVFSAAGVSGTNGRKLTEPTVLNWHSTATTDDDHKALLNWRVSAFKGQPPDVLEQQIRRWAEHASDIS